MKILAKYIHGSEDSLDTDTYYIVDKVPSFQEAKEYCDAIRDENANLLSIDSEGHVNACYKGTIDECNNSLYDTYHLHPQSYPLLISSKVKRDQWLKSIRAIRIILSHLSRSQYRAKVKSALRSSMGKRIETLKSIDLNDIEFNGLEHNQSGKDIMKVIAFQIGQTLALLSGVECYTKSSVASRYKQLKPFLYREANVDKNILNDMLFVLCERISDEILIDGEQYVVLHDMNHSYNLKTEKPER